MRVALLGSPRSGNTWVRLLLSTAYECASLAAHSPNDVPWDMLPQDTILQMHPRREPSLVAQFGRLGFRIVAVARHPLDVLISILHFAQNDPSPARWLEGEAGDELALLDGTPLSEAFVNYATGPRARALLAVSRDWWSAPDALRVRYEDVVASPIRQLQTLVEAIGTPARRPIADAVEANTLDRLRATSTNQHFWQGRPGNWKTVLTEPVARDIAAAHSESFELFSYECDADGGLTADAAAANWAQIARPTAQLARDRYEAVRRTDSDRIRHLLAEQYLLLRHVRDLEDNVRELQDALARTRGEKESLQLHAERELEMHVDAADRLRADVDWRSAVIDRLQDEVEWRKEVMDRQHRDLERVHAQLAATETAVADLLRSRSIRYTAALRAAVRVVRHRR